MFLVCAVETPIYHFESGAALRRATERSWIGLHYLARQRCFPFLPADQAVRLIRLDPGVKIERLGCRGHIRLRSESDVPGTAAQFIALAHAIGRRVGIVRPDALGSLVLMPHLQVDVVQANLPPAAEHVTIDEDMVAHLSTDLINGCGALGAALAE